MGAKFFVLFSQDCAEMVDVKDGPPENEVDQILIFEMLRIETGNLGMQGIDITSQSEGLFHLKVRKGDSRELTIVGLVGVTNLTFL